VTGKSDHDDDQSWAFLAPTDLREHDLPSQAAFGFHRGRTQELLNRAADTIERLNRELAVLRQERETWMRERDRLEAQLEEAKTRAELLVGEALLDAHKASQVLKAEAEVEAEKSRAEAETLLEHARQDAQQLAAEAHAKANQLVSEAAAEVERLAAQAEQYKLLAADVQHRSIEFLRRGLDALGADPADPETAKDEIAAFRKPDQRAAGSPQAGPLDS
jgi:cell division septum initiation protein DivIVA